MDEYDRPLEFQSANLQDLEMKYDKQITEAQKSLEEMIKLSYQKLMLAEKQEQSTIFSLMEYLNKRMYEPMRRFLSLQI